MNVLYGFLLSLVERHFGNKTLARSDRLGILELYFQTVLREDAKGGSDFDVECIAAIRSLRSRYTPHSPGVSVPDFHEYSLCLFPVPVDARTTRRKRLAALKGFYIRKLSENIRGFTSFDLFVLATIAELKERYPTDPREWE